MANEMIMQDDFWRDIPGTDGKYQISRAGDVRHVWPSGHVSSVKPYIRNGFPGSKNKIRACVPLRLNGKQIFKLRFSLLTSAWKGPAPPGMVYYHKNGICTDDYLGNVGLIDRLELCRINGPRATRKSVEMVDAAGNVVALFNSAREAATANHIDLACVTKRCKGLIKKPFDLIGYTFRWEEVPTEKRKNRNGGKHE